MTGPDRPIVALLETRLSREFARLIERHGGSPLQVESVLQKQEPSFPAIRELLSALCAQQHELVIFMTAPGVSVLFQMAENEGRRDDLTAALRKVTTLCRGPKAAAALRSNGVAPSLIGARPFTSAQVLDALSDFELEGRRILLLHCGERHEMLAETLLARRAEVHEAMLYRWVLPPEVVPLERLVRRVIGDGIDALAVTCQIQFRHLYRVAERLELERPLLHALQKRVLVGAVGPSTEAVLTSYGVQARVIPENPSMGALAIALMRALSPEARRGSDPKAPHQA